MLLKIKTDNNGGWAIYGPTVDIDFKNLTKADTEKSDYVVNRKIISPDSINYILLTFTQNNQVKKIIFDTVAYLCDDKGDTIQKIKPNGEI